jgi:transposase
LEDTLAMSEKERRCLVAMRLHHEGKETLADGAKRVGVGPRQMRRKYKRYREEGDRGLCHRSRGRPSNRAKPPEVKEAALKQYREGMAGFGPTFAQEKLSERGWHVDHETLRRWLLEAGLWERARKRKAHRRWRERKAHFGEMVQMDGTFFDWFGSGRKDCLFDMVDDATGATFALLFEEETTEGAMRTLMGWIERYGVPRALYTDRKSVYITEREPTLEELEKGEVPLTQFGRACSRLGIRIIAAHSPQAKGRVERKNGVYQDRLAKELKMRGIGTLDAANEFLQAGFLDQLNEKFSRAPAQPEDYHLPLPPGLKLEDVFCFEESRKVSNDWTVRYENRVFQITGPPRSIPPAKGVVFIRRRLDGGLRMYYRERPIDFREIAFPSVPARAASRPAGERKGGVRRPKPAVDHPWRGHRFGAGAPA